MQRADTPDISSLAHLAQHPDAELRPVLLRVQAQTFAAAPYRDTGTVAAFEAIALGLIPLVTDDVLSVTAALLRSVPETPPRVLAALTARLVRTVEAGIALEAADHVEADEPDEPSMRSDDIVRDPNRVLDGRLLADLVDEARDDPDLAAMLLERPEPTPLDLAELYRHADTAVRARIREELKSAAPLWTQPVRKPAPERMRSLVLRAADLGDVAGLERLTAWHLGLTSGARFDLVTEPGRELFVCTLLAFGFQPAECIRVVLSVDGAMAQSVSTVFGLAALARATPVWVAAILAGCPHTSPAIQGGAAGRVAESRATAIAGQLRADGRADRAGARSEPDERAQPIRSHVE